jgi:hypothetical protein
MCTADESLLENLHLQPLKTAEASPPALRASSTVSGNSSDGSESDDSRDLSGIVSHTPTSSTATSTPKISISRRRLLVLTESGLEAKQQQQELSPTCGSWSSLAFSVSTGVLNAAIWIVFSQYFPFILAPQAANLTYHKASFEYVPDISHFDNTAWTYGTDYALALIMSLLVVSIMRHSRPNVSDRLCRRTASLLLIYGLSVTAGGIAHHNFVTLESRNTLAFRLLWTMCVGTVCFASCSMGMIGTEALKKFQEKLKQGEGKMNDSSSSSLLLKVPILSDAFWMAFGGAVTAFCAAGGLSFQRPACDIFVAGITQSPSTFYCMIFFFLVQHPRIAVWAKVMGLVGFILNAPLLPMYPLLVQYTNLSLASVNTLLHSWLCVAWSMQGISMQHVIQSLCAEQDEEKNDLPAATAQAKKIQ